MKGFIIILPIIAAFSHANAYDLVWEGNAMKVLKYDAPAQSGLDAVYVADGVDGLSLSFIHGSASEQVRWYKYSTLGGGYAQEISAVDNVDGKSVVSSLDGDMGYYIESGNERYSFWLVDYSRHKLVMNGLYQLPSDDCDYSSLHVDGVGDEIAYYGVNGRKFVLSRELELSYRSLVYDENTGAYRDCDINDKFDFITDRLRCVSPLRSTEYVLTGDRFMKEWGGAETVASQLIQPTAVSAHISAVQADNSADNRLGTAPSGSLGGSAPCVVDFKAAVTDAVAFNEWQFSATPDFEDIYLREQDAELTYTFFEEGISYVRFLCADATGACDYYSEPFTVTIGASSLKCPNAFSPGNADGINDEWKVSYTSIIEFKCHIFNRNGLRMYAFTDPAKGWDGKYKGKNVPSGVYYYIITAKGADGKRYELSGDINIISYR